MLPLRSFSRALAQIRPLCSNVPATTKNDFEINPRFVNRNPRNLEQMLLARKPSGYEWDYSTREFWYRLDIEVSLKHVKATVLHNGGSAVVKAFSGEWGIKRQMVSSVDRTAAYNVGRVLARRCLEAGIVAVHYEVPSSMKNSQRVQAFLEGFTSEGVPIKEPEVLDEIEDRPLATMYR